MEQPVAQQGHLARRSTLPNQRNKGQDYLQDQAIQDFKRRKSA